MLAVISPAKTLDLSPPDSAIEYTQPELLEHAEQLVEVMKKKNKADIGKLMSISDKLAELNLSLIHI